MSKASKSKPATAKSLEKTAASTKLPKPPKKAKEQQPLNRKERREAAWLRQTKRKEAKQAVAEVAAKTSGPGFTYAQLEAPGLMAKPQPKPPAGLTLEQIFLEVIAEQAELEATSKVVSLPEAPYYPWMTVTVGGEEIPLVDYEDEEEPLGAVALRNVMEAEVRRLLEKTGAIFTAYCSGSSAETQLAVGETFEKEGESPLGLRLAEVIIADDPAKAIEDFLSEVHDQVGELQLILSAYDPEGELEKSALNEATVARLKKAAGEEAVRLNIAERLAGLMSGAPVEIDEATAALIAEAAQAAEAKRQERALFRRTLSQGLRQRKEREGRPRPSKSPGESGNEEFIQFLISHRDNLAAVRESLPFHLREQVDNLLEDDNQKKPLRRLITAVTTDANRLWAELKARLAAGASNPETAVAQNAAAMKNLLGILVQIRTLQVQLTELDKPQPVAMGTPKPLIRDKSWRGSFPMATVALQDLFKLLAARTAQAAEAQPAQS